MSLLQTKAGFILNMQQSKGITNISELSNISTSAIVSSSRRLLSRFDLRYINKLLNLAAGCRYRSEGDVKLRGRVQSK